MKRKLMMFITGMLLTASLLMGCASSTSGEVNDSKNNEKIEDNSNSNSNNTNSNLSEDSSNNNTGNDDEAFDKDSTATNSVGKVDRTEYSRLIQYMECTTYEQISTLINEDTADGYPIFVAEIRDSSLALNEYIMYVEYKSLKIDGIVYDDITIIYREATNEIIQLGMQSEVTSEEKCRSFERFTLDYWGDDYVAGELGEALDSRFIYNNVWFINEDEDNFVQAAAPIYEGKNWYSFLIRHMEF